MYIGYIANVVLNLFVFLLLIAVYTYILKLEDAACACADHPNKDFIKNFSIFALVFLAIITFLPMNFIMDNFGQTVGGLFAFVKFVFYIVCIVYFYMILDYVRYLINEKCKCSDDYRRSLIMAGSVIELVILFLILLVIIIMPIIFNSVSIVVKNMGNFERDVSNAVRAPYKSMKKIPANLKGISNMISGVGKQSKKGFKQMMKTNKYGGF